MKDLPEELREPLLDELNNIIDKIDDIAKEFNISQDEVLGAICKLYTFASQLTEDGKLNPLQEQVISNYNMNKRQKLSEHFLNN